MPTRNEVLLIVVGFLLLMLGLAGIQQVVRNNQSKLIKESEKNPAEFITLINNGRGCSIYRIDVSGIKYLVNTNGGIIKEEVCESVNGGEALKKK